MNNEYLLSKMIEHRRYIHKNPELGRQEIMTQKYIIEQIERLDLPYSKLGTSTICDLIINDEYPTVALRADIDALALTEENNVEYASVNDGVMHACGHDGHSAILLGVIEYLVAHKNELNVNVRFIFQCDEEKDGGAKDICEAGYLKEVESIFALHLDNNYPVGIVAYKMGQVNAGGDEFTFEFKGKQAHGAYPHQGVDSIVCSANFITSAQQLVARTIDPVDSAVFTIGTINGPGTANTICKQVTMEATLRNLNPQTRANTIEYILNLAQCQAKACNCEVNVIHTPSYPPLVNDNPSVDYVINNAKSLNYELAEKTAPSMGLEDFAYYLEETKGAFFNIGSCIENDYRNAHSSTFDFDEQALLVGASVQIANVLNFRNTYEN